MSRKSAGRPKKAGARKPCGRLAFVNDNGTDELLMQRALAADPKEARSLAIVMASSQDVVTLDGPDSVVKKAVRDIAAARKRIHMLASDRRLSYVLGLLHARKSITGAQHYAGTRYASLYVTSSYRAVRQQSVLGKMVGGGNGGMDNRTPQEAEDAAAAQRQAYLAARLVLTRQGISATGVVDNVCVFEILPSARQLDDLRMGLDALRDHFETEGRKR